MFLSAHVLACCLLRQSQCKLPPQDWWLIVYLTTLFQPIQSESKENGAEWYKWLWENQLSSKIEKNEKILQWLFVYWSNVLEVRFLFMHYHSKWQYLPNQFCVPTIPPHEKLYPRLEAFQFRYQWHSTWAKGNRFSQHAPSECQCRNLKQCKKWEYTSYSKDKLHDYHFADIGVGIDCTIYWLMKNDITVILHAWKKFK